MFDSLFKDNSTMAYVILLFGGSLIFICFMHFFQKKKGGDVKKWLLKNPTASKIIVKQRVLSPHTNKLLNPDGLYIISVIGNHEKVDFTEGLKQGFYILPGKYVIESTFTMTTKEPSLIKTKKTLVSVYGPTKHEIQVESEKTYELSYNLDQKTYNFFEI